MKTLLLATACLFLIPVNAHAADMTEDSIRAFLEETTRLTHANNGMSDDDIVAFLNTHIADNGRFKSKLLYSINGQTAEPRDVMLDKEGFINNVMQGRNTMQNYTSSVLLKKADIHGNSAAILTTTEESGLAPMEGNVMVPFTGISNCQQSLREKGGKIVLAAASCETVITFKSE